MQLAARHVGLEVGDHVATITLIEHPQQGLVGADDVKVAVLSGADEDVCSRGRASELLYTGRPMAAEEAERWGVFNRRVELVSLHAEALALAASIAAFSARPGQGPVFQGD